MSQAVQIIIAPIKTDKNRVDRFHARVMDRNCAGDDGDRADGIAQHMHECGADIQIAVLLPAQTPHDAAVEHESERGHPQHGLFGDVAWAEKSFPSFVEDENRDAAERQRIDEGGQNAGAVVAVSLYAIRGLSLEIEADGSENERKSIR